MRKTFAFNQERQLKSNYGTGQKVAPVIKFRKPKPTSADESRKEAKDWNDNYWPALRHVKLFNRIGRERWLKVYNTPEFILGIGGKNKWRGLLNEMKKIMDGEK